MAVAQKESGAWLNALPTANLGLLMDDDCLRISVALRLGATICVPHKCRCGADVDTYGRHGLCCGRSAGRAGRHSAVNELVFRSLGPVNIIARLKPQGLSKEDAKRPDGMTLGPWERGLPLAWDFTCVDTMAPSHIVGSLATAGHAAGEAEKLKCRKYEHLEGRFIFCPIAVETFGPWGPATKELVACIGRRLAEKTGEMRSTDFLRQRISVAIQRGNAVSVLGTHTAARGLEEIFYVLSLNR